MLIDRITLDLSGGRFSPQQYEVHYERDLDGEPLIESVFYSGVDIDATLDERKIGLIVRELQRLDSEDAAEAQIDRHYWREAV